MAKFSKRSKEILKDADVRLQQICLDVIDNYDFAVVCSYRNKEDQDKAYRMGYSKLKYPDSLHNHKPSMAIDIIPYPSRYDNEEEFYKLATWIFKSANHYGIKIIWGGHWKKFRDLPHFQLQL
ncbi:MAG: M15 family metallopeptidase [Spirochaetes bacterium]|nr:M15 family metallopeptidase [Spirochaetota bacterium]